MLYTGLFKRIVPFVLTFAAGLLLASIFVPIGLPNVDKWSESRRSRDYCHRKKHFWLDRENTELKEKIRELRRENEELRRDIPESDMMFDAVPPVSPDAHHPPAPPKRPKHPRFE